MRKRAREIAAVVLLVMLGLGVAVGMGWYILVGHNWNVAASNIDDSIGQMDGYAIFLFEGTRQRGGSASLPDVSSERSGGRTAAQSAGAPSGSSASPEAASAGGSMRKDVEMTRGYDGSASLDELAASYREKGATVFVLDVADLRRYEDPLVVSKGGMRVGLASEGTPARRAAALVDVKLLARQKAGFVVMMTDDASLSDTDLRGVDVMVCGGVGGEPGGGRYIGSMYCVDAPYLGEVQAVIVSPSGVISSKTIETG